jgi:hypothetical protein
MEVSSTTRSRSFNIWAKTPSRSHRLRRHRGRPVPWLGSTLIAADKTGRVCRGVELDALDVDVIVRRLEAATGNQGVLVETAETFEALATQGAGTGVALRPAPLSPTRNGRLLPVKPAGACTAEVRGSNPLRSTRKSAQTDVTSQGQK